MIGHLQKQYNRKFSVTREGSTSATFSAPGVTSLTFSHTSGSGVNRVIVVTAEGITCGTDLGGVAGVTWNGIALTEFRKSSNTITGSACYANRGIFYLLNPPANTTANVVVTYSYGNSCGAQANNYYYVSQAQPFNAFAISPANVANNSISLNLTTTHQNSYVIAHTADNDSTITFSGGVTKRAGAGYSSMADGFFANASGITIVADPVATTNCYEMTLSELWAN